MNRLKALREAKGLKQTQMTEMLNINQGNYSRYEKGILTPTTETLILLSNFYNVSIDYLLGLDNANDDIKIQLNMIQEYIENIKKNL